MGVVDRLSGGAMQAIGACLRKPEMLRHGVLKNREPFDAECASMKATWLHATWFGRLPHSHPQQLKFNLLAASVIDCPDAMSRIVLPFPPRRAAGAGSRAYRKWRGAAPPPGR